MKRRWWILALTASLVGCQGIAANSSVRDYPGASFSRLWLSASAVASRQWTIVTDDSTTGRLIAVAGQGNSSKSRPYEYTISVRRVVGGGRVSALCRSELFGRMVDMEELYLQEVSEKLQFLNSGAD